MRSLGICLPCPGEPPGLCPTGHCGFDLLFHLCFLLKCLVLKAVLWGGNVQVFLSCRTRLSLPSDRRQRFALVISCGSLAGVTACGNQAAGLPSVCVNSGWACQVPSEEGRQCAGPRGGCELRRPLQGTQLAADCRGIHGERLVGLRHPMNQEGQCVLLSNPSSGHS